MSDLRRDPLPRGPWDLITCFAYEQPSLWPALCTALSEGGWLIAEIATQVNLERHARPPARFLIEPGAMRDRLRELEIIRLDEGWHDGRHTARVAARRSQARG